MLFVRLFFCLHKTLLQITPPKILEKTCCHFWVRNNAVGLWCCRWGHGCYDTSLHAAASSSSASCQSWMAWKRATSRLAPKPHGKMTWDIYFKICSNVPTPCEKNLVQYYQKFKSMSCFFGRTDFKLPHASQEHCKSNTVRHLLPASLIAQAAQALC